MVWYECRHPTARIPAAESIKVLTLHGHSIGHHYRAQAFHRPRRDVADSAHLSLSVSLGTRSGAGWSSASRWTMTYGPD
jgi:hypothetical protein